MRQPHHMTSAQIIFSLLALLTANLAAQGKEPAAKPAVEKPVAKTVFVCPMHDSIRSDKNMPCEVCGMDLVEIPVPIKKVKVPLLGLRDYCEDYIRRELEERHPWGADPFRLIEAHVALEGDGSRTRLRNMLRKTGGDWLRATVFQLGKMQDRASIQDLKALLAKGTFSLAHDFYCTQHPDETANEAGRCKECGTQLSNTYEAQLSQHYLAGALHEMGIAEGLQILEECTKRKGGSFAFSLLALRDSPHVRSILTEAASSESPRRRSAAVLAQVQLGVEDSLEPAIKLLEGDDPLVRSKAIWSLGVSGMKPAIEPLLKIVRDKSLPLTDRVTAAVGLVKLGKHKQIGFLMDAYHKASNREERYVIYNALGEVGDTRALPLLQAGIEDGKMRNQAVAAAARIMSREAERARSK